MEKNIEFSKIDQIKIENYLNELRMNLKQMAILTNNSIIDKNEFEESMKFLRIHYNYLQEKLAYHNYSD